MNRFVVEKENTLYEYLKDKNIGSKNNIKSLLSKKYIRVNDKIITKYDYKLKCDDVIDIGCNYITYDRFNIKIIYEDDDIIVLDKPVNVLSIETEKSDNSLYHMVSSYVKRKNKNNKIFVVHRLDKDTSGVILFAKNIRVKEYLQNNWSSYKRLYKAVVHGIVKENDTIKLKLKDSKTLLTYVSKDGKDAITKYKKEYSNDNYSLVDIEILTGRKNQIRVSFNHIGHPILGDRKYGVKDNEKYLYLHAYLLEVNINGKVFKFKSDIPKYFKKALEKHP